MKAVRQLRSLPPASRFLLGINAVSSLGNGLVLPFLVVYLHEAVGLSTRAAASLLSVTSVAAILGGLLAGLAADRFGAATASAANLTVAAIGVASYAFVQNTTGAVVAAFVVGMGVGGNAAFMAVLADVTPDDQHQSAFGFNAVMVNAGIAVGGVLGGFVGHVEQIWSFRILYLCDAVSYLLAAACMAVLAVRLRRQTRAGTPDPAGTPSPTSYRTVLRQRPFVILLVLVALLYFIGYGQLESGFPAFVITSTPLGSRSLATLFVLNTIVVIIAQLLLDDLLQRRTPRQVATAAAVLWAGSWLFLAWAAAVDSPGWALVCAGSAMTIFAVGEVCFARAVPTLVNRFATDGRRGRYNGAYSIATSIGFIAGPAYAGLTLGAGRPALLIGTLLVVGVVVVTVLLRASIVPGASAGQENMIVV